MSAEAVITVTEVRDLAERLSALATWSGTAPPQPPPPGTSAYAVWQALVSVWEASDDAKGWPEPCSHCDEDFDADEKGAVCETCLNHLYLAPIKRLESALDALCTAAEVHLTTDKLAPEDSVEFWEEVERARAVLHPEDEG